MLQILHYIFKNPCDPNIKVSLLYANQSTFVWSSLVSIFTFAFGIAFTKLLHLLSLNSRGWYFGSWGTGGITERIFQSIPSPLYIGSSTSWLEIFNWIRDKRNDRKILFVQWVQQGYTSFHVWSTANDQICLYCQFEGAGFHWKAMGIILIFFFKIQY